MRENDDPAAGPEYRCRDLTAYDHTPLDGEMFLQVFTYIYNKILITFHF